MFFFFIRKGPLKNKTTFGGSFSISKVGTKDLQPSWIFIVKMWKTKTRGVFFVNEKFIFVKTERKPNLFLQMINKLSAVLI